jgi:hypothetical protein
VVEIAGRKLKGKVNPSMVAVARPRTPMEETFPCTQYSGSIAQRDAG